ncbi:MAG: hypothetical protein AMJ95_01485 [Omnitrophica WOR_2 bacterium SM23_72]|nr:MAG: hypothetical protein AMJ95_01485 [Omnitrophica WOR_2 bacterium SM23_72]
MKKERFTSERIGELLIKAGIITRKQLNRALKIHKHNSHYIGNVLIKLNFAKEEDVVSALMTQYHFPYIPLENYNIDSEILNIIPEPVARKYLVIPLDKVGKCFTVAMADPLDEQAVIEIETLSHCHVQAFIATPSDIENNITKYYSVDKYSPLFPMHLKYC